MITRSIPRRHVLSSLILSVAAASSVGAVSAERSAASGLLPHLDAARLIGRRYLELAPQERSAAQLRHMVFGGADGADVGPQSLARLRQRIDARRRRDFATGDTIILDGWLLARTEARLCALSTFV